jgi:hypothetical protein
LNCDEYIYREEREGSEGHAKKFSLEDCFAKNSSSRVLRFLRILRGKIKKNERISCCLFLSQFEYDADDK